MSHLYLPVLENACQHTRYQSWTFAIYLLSNEISRYYTSNSISNDRWHEMSSSCSIRHLLRNLKVERDGEHHLTKFDQPNSTLTF